MAADTDTQTCFTRRQAMRSSIGEPLVLALLRAYVAGAPLKPGRDLEESEVDWAIASGLGPILFAATRGCAERIPESRGALLRGADRLRQLRHEDLVAALCELLDRAGEHGEEVTLLKGIALAEHLYEAPHHRFMQDLDVLVPPRLAPAIQALLGDLGYQDDGGPPFLDYATHHHLRPLYHGRTGVCVEVHTRLMPPEEDLDACRPFEPGFVEQETRAFGFRGRPVRHLSPELHLAYLASHWALVFRPETGPRALLDAMMLIRRTPGGLDWERLLGSLEDRRVAAHSALLLRYLHGRALAKIPEAVLADRRLDVIDRFTLRFLLRMMDRYHVRGCEPGRFARPSVLAVAWTTLLAERPPGSVARLCWKLLFPPGHPERFRLSYQGRRLGSVLLRND